MTVKTEAIIPTSTGVGSELDLEVSVVESGPVVAELMRGLVTDRYLGGQVKLDDCDWPIGISRSGRGAP
jgi:hypothetical protein